MAIVTAQRGAARGVPDDVEPFAGKFDVLLRLEPAGERVALDVLSGLPAGSRIDGLVLDPRTMLVTR